MTNLARNLEMDTVAEGIETREHFASVSGVGCDEVQGYYFSRPVPANQVGEVLALCRLKCLASNQRAAPRNRFRPPHRIRTIR